jgi:hypothetical protein
MPPTNHARRVAQRGGEPERQRKTGHHEQRPGEREPPRQQQGDQHNVQQIEKAEWVGRSAGKEQERAEGGKIEPEMDGHFGVRHRRAALQP